MFPTFRFPKTETLSLPHADAKMAVESLARDAGYDPDTVTFAPRGSTLVHEEVTA